ncbi:hypothetical protein C6P40_005010 [Pichia californica]|uniref:Uncharacterized protein n=1 Tax=Pichia californica TaxID=460514 RepID=A0A9P6WQ89_9ASCO|nr:hypothetical protein C6P40_005010 [[Candida] californica]
MYYDTFQFSINKPSNHHFPKTKIPLSIDHSNLKYFNNVSLKSKIDLKRQQQKLKNSNILSSNISSSSSSDEEVIADDNHSIIHSERDHDLFSISNLHDTQFTKYPKNSVDNDNDNDNNNNNNNNNDDDDDYDNSNINFDDTTKFLKRKVIDNSIPLKKHKN